MSKRAKTTTHLRMNTHFDTAKARAALEQMYKRPTDASSDDTEMDLVGGTANSTYVRRIKYPPSLRMMAWDGTEDVEVTVKLRGILCGFSLPPVAKPNKLSQLRNLRQHVKVTALGLDAFDQAMANLLQIHGMFSSFVGSAEAVQPLDFLPYEGNPSIDSHARYFTDRHLSPYEKNEPLSHWIDPERALTAIQPPTFIHGPDNIVDYCTLMGDEYLYDRYALHDPKLFKAGDIVEISFSCVAIPVKGSAYKLILNLRALTLIDDQLRLVRSSKTMQTISANRT
ncbi:hypothetical protein DFP72DRAFT_1027664 [Ephemerocybe angulata]|uniref:Uncharacterized protein n=1 Tax=Ephemerocybe angulata TaxID=980116 RepID=A0A8H6LSD0_9AGAR|nr:hypothetical protein DFP72DRAFT_1027664 [Tulosesus angulatus]